MSTDNNLFNFSRKLPAPFDSSSARVSVTSKYGEGTNATLCAAVIKAVNAVCACKYGTGEGAVGKSITEVLPSINHRSVRMRITWSFMTALAVILVRAFMIRAPSLLSHTLWARREETALLCLWQ